MDSMDSVECENERALLGVVLELIRTPLVELDPAELLSGVCADCATFAGVGGAAIVLAEGAAVSGAVSSPEVADLVAAQQESGDGPAVTENGEMLVIPDLAAASSLDAWASRALGHGFQATVVFPLRHGARHLGTLQVLLRDSGTPAASLLATYRIIAESLTSTLLNVELYRKASDLTVQLSHALQSRVPIEQAKGIIAERQALTVGGAFGVLRDYSRRHRLSMQRAAVDIINGASLDATPGSGRRQPPRAKPVLHSRHHDLKETHLRRAGEDARPLVR